jgi:acetylornithine deacetylase/succinyl-diaminopimelate desuccinylase-like protein
VENAPRGVRVDVTHEVGNPAVRAPIDHPAVAAAKRSVEAVFGRPAALIGNGGSIGAASVFARRFSCPQIMLGFGLPTDAIHAPNEHIDVWRLVSGAKTIARFYDELATR